MQDKHIRKVGNFNEKALVNLVHVRTQRFWLFPSLEKSCCTVKEQMRLPLVMKKTEMCTIKE